ncbi:hypothetical protein RQP46_006045 [Phenoliferia psychrophenolica]
MGKTVEELTSPRTRKQVVRDRSGRWRVIQIWDLSSGELKLSLFRHIPTVRGLAVSDRHPYLFSCAFAKMVKCWDLETKKTGVLPHLQSAVTPSLFVPEAQPEDSAERVARVFIRHAAFLKIYSSYVNAFDSALARLQTWTVVPEPPRARSNSSTSSPPLGSTSKMGSPPYDPSTPAASNLSTSQRKRIKSYLKISLESYLLLPVQRVPRYRMLLETLLSCTPKDNLVDQALLELSPIVLEALELISAVATDMNERKRESEGRTQLLQWQHRIGNTFRSPLVQPHRSLLRTGTFTLVRTVKRSTAFLEAAGSRSPVPSASPNLQAPDVVQVHSLVTESTQQKLIALLCTDIIVFVKEPGPDRPR